VKAVRPGGEDAQAEVELAVGADLPGMFVDLDKSRIWFHGCFHTAILIALPSLFI